MYRYLNMVHLLVRVKFLLLLVCFVVQHNTFVKETLMIRPKATFLFFNSMKKKDLKKKFRPELRPRALTSNLYTVIIWMGTMMASNCSYKPRKSE